jgi:peptidoglycan/xylan/chitin deacetylase (PgdA/CDA1 family)
MIAIINHHYIRKDFNNKYDSIFGITPFLFEKKLLFYMKNYNLISQNELVESINNQDIKNDKSVLLTFDDGLKEQYKLAFPILKKHKVNAVFFINTSPLVEKKVLPVHKIHIFRSMFAPEIILNELINYTNVLGKTIDEDKLLIKATQHYKYDQPFIAKIKYKLNFILNEDELDAFSTYVFNDLCKLNEEFVNDELYMNSTEVSDLGKVDMIGSHSHNHIPLGLYNDETQQFNIRKSKEILENIIGNKVLGFSYPYGNEISVNGLHKNLQNEGYHYAVTTERAINLDLSNKFYLSRLDNNDTTFGKSYLNSDHDFFNSYKQSKWKF